MTKPKRTRNNKPKKRTKGTKKPQYSRNKAPNSPLERRNLPEEDWRLEIVHPISLANV